MQQFRITATDTARRLAALPQLAADGAAELTARLTASCAVPEPRRDA
jgi:hypothetical protein